MPPRDCTHSAGWLALRFTMLLLLLCCPLLACDGQSSSTPTTGPTTSEPASPTIVSLTPAITQMLIDMGKRDHLVGVSREDDASLGLPVCGSYNDPIPEKILDLKPDLVITESTYRELSPGQGLLQAAADRGAFKFYSIPHSRSIADVERALTHAQTGLGTIVGDTQAADRARELMQARLDFIRTAVADKPAPRVLMLIEPSTLGALGPGATHDEMLRLAGGSNAIADFKTDYLKLSREQIQERVRPDVVLIFEPNGRAVSKDDPRLRALEGLAVPAVMQRRIVVIDHPKAMLPSTALPEVVAQMAKAIHPDRAEQIDQAYAMAQRLLEKQGDPAGSKP